MIYFDMSFVEPIAWTPQERNAVTVSDPMRRIEGDWHFCKYRCGQQILYSVSRRHWPTDVTLGDWTLPSLLHKIDDWCNELIRRRAILAALGHRTPSQGGAA